MGALKVCAAHLADHGPEGLGALIVSMTRSVEHLFAVRLFAREAGLLRHDDPEGPWLPLPVVPLLETIADLGAGPAILAAWLDAPMVRRSLVRQAGGSEPVQQVMDGHSDSGKDGGIAASVWAIHRAQAAIAKVGRARGVRIRFFHGRGGSIGRGAGPTHRLLGALPQGSLAGDLRLTEPGETIAQKDANRVTAAHELELLCAGTLGAPLSGSRADVQASLTRRAEALAPLHRHQIALLANWRAHRAAGDTAAAETRRAALLPMLNAIAAGLGATG